MDIDWKSVAGAVGPFAPTLGGLLGGAFGGPIGGIAGRKAGELIAEYLGVQATPAAIGKAIAEDKRAAEKLAQAEADRRTQEILAWAQVETERVEQQGLTARVGIREVNETIRSEYGRVSWFHWRHLIGYLVLGYGLNQLLLLNLAAFFPALLAPSQAVELFNSTALFTAGLFALLGWVSSDTTNRINTAVTGEHSAGGVINSLRNFAGKGKPQ